MPDDRKKLVFRGLDRPAKLRQRTAGGQVLDVDQPRFTGGGGASFDPSFMDIVKRASQSPGFQEAVGSLTFAGGAGVGAIGKAGLQLLLRDPRAWLKAAKLAITQGKALEVKEVAKAGLAAGRKMKDAPGKAIKNAAREGSRRAERTLGRKAGRAAVKAKTPTARPQVSAIVEPPAGAAGAAARTAEVAARTAALPAAAKRSKGLRKAGEIVLGKGVGGKIRRASDAALVAWIGYGLAKDQGVELPPDTPQSTPQKAALIQQTGEAIEARERLKSLTRTHHLKKNLIEAADGQALSRLEDQLIDERLQSIEKLQDRLMDFKRINPGIPISSAIRNVVGRPPLPSEAVRPVDEDQAAQVDLHAAIAQDLAVSQPTEGLPGDTQGPSMDAGLEGIV